MDKKMEDDFTGIDKHFAELVRRAFDGEISEADRLQLQHELSTSSAARRFYMQYSETHALLHALLHEGAEPKLDFEQTNSLRAVRSRRPVVEAFLAIAVALCLGLTLWTFSASRSVHDSRTAVGETAGTPQETTGPAADRPDLPPQLVAGWKPGEMTLRVGERFSSQDAQKNLWFPKNVQVSLLPGAELELVSETEVRLISGRLQIDVGRQGRGFTVLTNETKVIDLGTVFGVGVDDSGEIDVVCFSGEVDIHPHREALTFPYTQLRNLNTGEALRFAEGGTSARIASIWRNTQDTNWSTRRPTETRSVIANVTDNLSSEFRPKFYAIIPNGLREDAKVYVDRPLLRNGLRAEWNGLTEEGIPEVLRNADYVQTFNNDKQQEDLEIRLTLSSPADVYILLDERHLIPEWLSRDFEATDLTMGIDLGSRVGTGMEETPPLGVTVPRLLGVGPGKSVDVPVTIWKRSVPAPGEIRLGPNGGKSEKFSEATQGAGSMYGIAVVPHQERQVARLSFDDE
ncbi:FecR domain-containing protein [Planctomicrobium sp. SH664]|uniref:FecR domain-containing protein n=1 Tax=Planctomicrobium sp. SH664 TaxID=3448125 RepID=UPI003F5B6995